MSISKTPVSIQMVTEIKEDNDTEKTSISASGTFYSKEGTAVIAYTETNEEVDDTKTLITINADRVSVKRSGAFSMKQVFVKGQPTENVYRHPYGTMHMETTTHEIVYKEPVNNQAGELKIHYTVRLNHVQERKHVLTLHVQEEKA